MDMTKQTKLGNSGEILLRRNHPRRRFSNLLNIAMLKRSIENIQRSRGRGEWISKLLENPKKTNVITNY
jgi:hypothetical protein